MIKEIPDCEWDGEAFTLGTPRDEAVEKCKELKSAAWYWDDVALLGMGGGKDDHSLAATEELREIDGDDKSFTTIHGKQGTKGRPAT